MISYHKLGGIRWITVGRLGKAWVRLAWYRKGKPKPSATNVVRLERKVG